MTPGYAMMFRSAIQVQAALITASVQVASRCSRFFATSAGTVAQAAARPLNTPAEQRQTAIEDAAWVAYAQHKALLQAATGLSRLGVLMFMNDLDRRRGDKPVPPTMRTRRLG